MALSRSLPVARSCRRLPRLALCSLAWLSALFALQATAATIDPYATVQPVASSREAAFVEALKAVVVRVSGRRDAVAQLGSALNSPQQYIQRFGLISQDQLEVRFDSVSIDRLLSNAGLPIWGHERPVVLVLLELEAGGATRLAGGETPAEYEIVAKAAQERGLPLKWPTDALDRPGTDPASLMQAAARYGANAALLGRARGAAVDWTLVSSDGTAQAHGGLEQGVHLAADTFARVFAVSGSTLDSVLVEVSGISDLDAYAATLNYLEAMTLVRAVALEQVSGDSMRFRLAVRGDASVLRRAIALDGRLVPVSDAGGGAGLAFRYQP